MYLVGCQYLDLSPFSPDGVFLLGLFLKTSLLLLMYFKSLETPFWLIPMTFVTSFAATFLFFMDLSMSSSKKFLYKVCAATEANSSVL